MSRKILFSLSCHLYLLSLFIFPGLSFADNDTGKEPSETEESYTTTKKSTEMAELLLFFEEKDLIVTATKHTQTLQDAPAIATVVTADEIRKMGARDIIDVLRRVPGIGITKGYFGLEEIEVRGIKTVYSEKVKLLIDGHSVNLNANGNATWGFDSLSVDNVKRLEIIRGPGSALYGSNAFSAVINVVTKDGKDIDGVVVSGSGGSFNTEKFNLQAGKNTDKFDVALSLDYINSSGPRLKVDKDILGNSGNTDDYENKLEAGLKAAYGDILFNSKYMAKKRGSYIGAAFALNDESQIEFWQYFAELAYRHDISYKGNLLIKGYIDEASFDAKWKLFPDGTTILGYGLLSNGMRGNPSLRERTTGAEIQIDYKLLSDNLLTVGAVVEGRRQYDVTHKTNFNPDPLKYNPSTYGLLYSSVQDISSWANWNKDANRDIWGVYLQDVWDFSKSVAMTLGVRHDEYSDFGSTTNPRAAIVWKFIEGWDAKVLYGRAFRAPSFVELYNINNPSIVGNSDLKPEKMETYEVSLGYGKNDYKSRISYFYNTFRDRIQLDSLLPPSKFENKGGANVQGVEMEIRKGFKNDESMYANYTYQWPKDEDSGKRLPDVPTHKGNLGGDIGFNKYLSANMNVFASAERPRADGDPRDVMPAYAVVDLTVIAKNLYPNLEIRGSAHNLLDKKYSDPSPLALSPTSGSIVPSIPDDFPREGINFLIEALYKF